MSFLLFLNFFSSNFGIYKARGIKVISEYLDTPMIDVIDLCKLGDGNSGLSCDLSMDISAFPCDSEVICSSGSDIFQDVCTNDSVLRPHYFLFLDRFTFIDLYPKRQVLVGPAGVSTMIQGGRDKMRLLNNSKLKTRLRAR